MRVRLAEIEDVDAVDELFSDNVDFQRFVMRVAIEDSIRARNMLVCEDKDLGEILAATHFRPTKKGYISIYEIAVKYKGRRIGNLLLDELKRSGLDIKLKVTEDNLGAIKFYERNGFEHVATEHGKLRKLIVFYYTNKKQNRLF